MALCTISLVWASLSVSKYCIAVLMCHPQCVNTIHNNTTIYKTLYYSNLKSCMFYLYKTAIIRFHVSENIKRESYSCSTFTSKTLQPESCPMYNISKRNVWEAFFIIYKSTVKNIKVWKNKV